MKLKTRTNQPVEDDKGVLNKVVFDDETNVINVDAGVKSKFGAITELNIDTNETPSITLEENKPLLIHITGDDPLEINYRGLLVASPALSLVFTNLLATYTTGIDEQGFMGAFYPNADETPSIIIVQYNNIVYAGIYGESN